MPIVQIELDVSRLKSGGSAAVKILDDVSRSVSDVQKNTSDSSAKFKKLASEILALAGAYKAVGAAMDFVSQGIDFNASLEQSKIGIASVIASVQKLTDEQGNVLQGQEAYQAALGMAEQAMNRIRIMGLETTATTEDLVAGFQQLIGPASAAGLSMEKTLEFTKSMVQSLGAIGIPFNQLSAEARSLLDGTIVPTQDRLATTLGITGEMVKNWKAQGILADMLLQKMSAFSAAGDDVAKTWSGVKSNLQDAISLVAAMATRGMYEDMKSSLMEVQKLLFASGDGAMGVSKDFEHIASLLESIADEIGTGILSGVNSLISGIKEFNAYIGENGAVNVFNDMEAAVKAATVALGALIVSRRANAMQFTLESEGTKKAVTGLGAYVVESYKVASAEKNKANATLAGAKADLDASRAALEKFKATQKSDGATKGAVKSGYARLAIQKQEQALIAANTAAEARYAAAVNASARASLLAAGATKALNVLKAGFMGVVNMLGGPLGIALTAASAATMYLMSRQDQAADAAHKHTQAQEILAKALGKSTDETGKAGKKLTELEKAQLAAAKKAADSAYIKQKDAFLKFLEDQLKTYEVAKAAMEKLAEENPDYPVPPAAHAEQYESLKNIAAAFRENKMSAEEVAQALGELRNKTAASTGDNNIFVASLDKILNGENSLVNLLLQAADAWTKYTEATKKAASGTKQINDEGKTLAKVLEAIKKAQGRDSVSTPEGRVATALSDAGSTDAGKKFSLTQKRKDNIAAQKDVEASISKAKELGSSEEEIKSLTDTLSLLKEIYPQLGKSISDTAQKQDEAQEAWKNLSAEMEIMAGTGSKVGLEMTKREKEIEKIGLAAKKLPLEIEAMKAAYKAAFQTDILKNFDKQMLSLQGNTKALRDIEIDEQVAVWRKQLMDAGDSADVAGEKVAKLKGLLEKQTEIKDAQTTLSFLKEVEELTGQYGIATAEQNRLLEMQADLYRDKLPLAMRPYIDQWEKAKKLEANRNDAWAGVDRGLKKYMAEATNYAKQAEDITTGFAHNLENALTSPIDEFMEKGKVSFDGFKGMFKGLLNDLWKMAVARPIAVQVMGVFNQGQQGIGTPGYAGGPGIGGSGGSGFSVTDLGNLVPDSWKSGVLDWLGLGGSQAVSAPYSGIAYAGIPSSLMPSSGALALGSVSGFGSNLGGSAASGMMYSGVPSSLQVSPLAAKWGDVQGSSLVANGPQNSAASAGMGALGYITSAIGGYFTGRGFYEGTGAKWGLPQGRETGWASGVGGAAGAVGGMALGSMIAGSTALAGTAMATGATLGSVIPGIGTAIGAVVGAIAAGLAGSLGGKDREMRVYTGLRTNLADPGAYIQTDQSQEAMAGAFGYGWTQADFMKDWGSINVKGSTGHSAYYIDPVHAGSKGDEVATSMSPYFKQVEETLLGMATSVTDLLPQQLKGQFSNWLRERPMVLEYKFKPGDLDQEGIETWIADWVGLTEDTLLRGLQELDFSAWKDQISVNIQDYSGFQMFLNAVNSIETVKKATEELVNPTSQFVTQAKEANAQLDAWALSLRQYGVTQEYAAELMEKYKQTSIDVFVAGFQEAFTPLPAFAQALKDAGEALDGHIAGLRELGATEEQIMGLEVKRSEVLNMAVADIMRQSNQDYLQRYTALAGGDTEGIGAAINRENELLQLAQKFGTGLEWTSVLLDKATSLNRQQFQDRTDWDVDSVKKAIADAGMTVETWYANFGKGEGFSPPENIYANYESLLTAEEEKRKLEALKKTQQQYLTTQMNSIRALVNAWEGVPQTLEDTRYGLHVGQSNVSLGMRQATAEQRFADLYAKALAGDSDAAQEMGSVASELLSLSKQTAKNEYEYQLVFNDVDRKLFDANIYAGKQVDTTQAQLNAAQAQLDAMGSANGLLGSQVDLSAQILAQEKALEAALKNLVKPEYAPPGTTPPGTTAPGTGSPSVGSSPNDWMRSVLQAKADASNRGENLNPDMTAGGWTPDKVMEAIVASGMTFDQWANTFGVAEGFVAGWDKVVAAKVAAMNSEFGGGWNEARLLQAIKDSGMTPGEWYFHFGKAEGFASGGVTPAGRPFWVGENGPELMMSPNQYGVLSNPESLRLTETMSKRVQQPVSFSVMSENDALRQEVRTLNQRVNNLVSLTENLVRHARDSADKLSSIKVEGLQTRAYVPPPPVVIPFQA